MAQGFLLKGSAIGIDGGLPWHYSEDLKRFKRRTMGCAVIMGRVTWDSIGRKALPGRRNIVISRSDVSGVEHYDSIEKAISACGNEDLWVIGGAQIYEAAMAYLNVLDITLVPDIIDRDDVVKPPYIDLSCWTAVWKRHPVGKKGLAITIYHRIDSD
ncbi:dihydrofolate reductase [Candidatus Spongiihabitans sp.]|uniref:dihydrofolate reductase n=1 Tax=Candidatus Spongiihabitans sp. TaxID=3101308 RepID=UPI003C7AC52A